MDEVEKYQLPDNINLPVSKVRKVTGTGEKKKKKPSGKELHAIICHYAWKL